MKLGACLISSCDPHPPCALLSTILEFKPSCFVFRKVLLYLTRKTPATVQALAARESGRARARLSGICSWRLAPPSSSHEAGQCPDPEGGWDGMYLPGCPGAALRSQHLLCDRWEGRIGGAVGQRTQTPGLPCVRPHTLA